MTNLAYIVLGAASSLFSIVSLYSAICSLRGRRDFMFAAETILAVISTVLACMGGVKVWW